MKTLLKIAWRNIWRNKVRSSIIFLSIALGLLAGLFTSAFVKGMMKQKITTVIEKEISHFQVHHPDFREEFTLKNTVENAAIVENEIKKNPDVVATTSRVITMVMMGSSKKNGAVKVTGVNPETEKLVTSLDNILVEGKYFEGVKRNPIVISEKTAEQYKIKLRSKVVLTMQDIDGEIIAGSFRVAGIYKSSNVMYDKMNVFVQKEDIQKLLSIGNQVHEIAILVNDYEKAEPINDIYKDKYKDLEILPWLDLAPGMRLNVQIVDVYTYIIVGIILFALLFSILNTMLMAVLERENELNVLIAIGMTKTKIFAMIMLETVFYALTGGGLGIILSYLIINYFGKHGLNMNAYEAVGFASTAYPFLYLKEYINVSVMVISMSILAAIYPALKAMRFNIFEYFKQLLKKKKILAK